MHHTAITPFYASHLYPFLNQSWDCYKLAFTVAVNGWTLPEITAAFLPAFSYPPRTHAAE